MPRTKTALLATLLLATACAAPSTATKPDATAAAGSVDAPAAKTKVVCEYVRPTGSNIAVRECREVRVGGDDFTTRGSDYFYKPPVRNGGGG